MKTIFRYILFLALYSCCNTVSAYTSFIVGNNAGVDNYRGPGNDSNLLIVFYVQIMPDDFVMQLHRF